MVEVTYPCYIQRKDSRGHWYWIYYAANREEIARSSESYVNREDCTHSIRLVQASQNHGIFYYD
jgi:uncharacterized protein YegP (UPF0339 family)